MQQNSSDEGDKSFMSMLNNPYINPGPQQQQQPSTTTSTSKQSDFIWGLKGFESSSDASKDRSLATNSKNTIDDNHTSDQVCHEAKQLLTRSAQDKYLSSESDEPFEWISATPIDEHKKKLPTSEEELIEMGLVNEATKEEGFKMKTIDEFFQHNKEDYKEIVEAFKQLEKRYDTEESKVYLIGEMSIQVLILSLVEDPQTSKKTIVGLKSLLVQT